MRVSIAVAVSILFLLVVGCSEGSSNQVQTQASAGSTGAMLSGTVRGGQQPIIGAHVYLFAASSTGYGGAGIAPSASNASVSLLTSAGNTLLDSSGGATNGEYYVTTDLNGSFSITGDYTCGPGQQVYLYAVGGNPGAGINSAVGLTAALGTCPAVGNFQTATPYIVLNEISTVATAYALAGFVTDATHVGSSGTALASTGITNAFANVANLETLSTGVALATTPAGNGTVPQSEINSLGNILAACVNSNGPGSTQCSTLFTNAKTGGSTGAVAADTATAAINIAHNPGANVAPLFGLSTPAPPFAPALSAQPNDFTVALNFTGLGSDQSAFPRSSIAIDGAGSAWVTNADSTPGSVTKLSSTGVVSTLSAGFSGIFGKIAIDPTGNAWIAASSVVELTNAGVAISPVGGFKGGGLGFSEALAIDGSGNAWVANTVNSYSVTKLNSSGVLGTYTAANWNSITNPVGVAIDNSGNAWIAVNGNGITELSNSGVVLSPIGGYTDGGILIGDIAIDGTGNVWVTDDLAQVSKFSKTGSASLGSPFTIPNLGQAVGIAIDGASNVWFADGENQSSINIRELSDSGAAISPISGYSYTGGGLSKAIVLALDGSGDIWTTSKSVGNVITVTEFIGAATPVVTPIAVGVKNETLGTRP